MSAVRCAAGLALLALAGAIALLWWRWGGAILLASLGGAVCA